MLTVSAFFTSILQNIRYGIIGRGRMGDRVIDIPKLSGWIKV